MGFNSAFKGLRNQAGSYVCRLTSLSQYIALVGCLVAEGCTICRFQP